MILSRPANLLTSNEIRTEDTQAAVSGLNRAMSGCDFGSFPMMRGAFTSWHVAHILRLAFTMNVRIDARIATVLVYSIHGAS
jgi:hypothetical protein